MMLLKVADPVGNVRAEKKEETPAKDLQEFSMQ